MAHAEGLPHPRPRPIDRQFEEVGLQSRRRARGEPMHTVPGGGRRETRLGESVVRVALTLQLGVGVGMSAAVAAMLYGFVAYPLPFPSGRAIVQVHDTAVASSPIIVTDRQFDDGWGEMTGPFEHVAGHFMGTGPIVPALLVGETERLSVCAVAGDLFGVLGVHPRLGRSFSDQELRTGAAVVLIAESVWRQRFGSRADVLGVTIPSDRGPYTVIGVVEDRYVFPANAEAWAPRIAYTGPGRFMALQILARLKPEWTVDRATKVVATLAPPVRAGAGQTFGSSRTSRRRGTGDHSPSSHRRGAHCRPDVDRRRRQPLASLDGPGAGAAP